jgi:hypothetical protein
VHLSLLEPRIGYIREEDFLKTRVAYVVIALLTVEAKTLNLLVLEFLAERGLCQFSWARL